MKSQGTTQTNAAIQSRIAQACASTEPSTKARNKALATVRWVLICASGYAALTPDARCIVVEDIASAQVFDGRDNEQLKARFWSIQLGTDCVPQLLP
jgi:hypothetical protein